MQALPALRRTQAATRRTICKRRKTRGRHAAGTCHPILCSCPGTAAQLAGQSSGGEIVGAGAASRRAATGRPRAHTHQQMFPIRYGLAHYPKSHRVKRHAHAHQSLLAFCLNTGSACKRPCQPIGSHHPERRQTKRTAPVLVDELRPPCLPTMAQSSACTQQMTWQMAMGARPLATSRPPKFEQEEAS